MADDIFEVLEWDSDAQDDKILLQAAEIIKRRLLTKGSATIPGFGKFRVTPSLFSHAPPGSKERMGPMYDHVTVAPVVRFRTLGALKAAVTVHHPRCTKPHGGYGCLHPQGEGHEGPCLSKRGLAL